RLLRSGKFKTRCSNRCVLNLELPQSQADSTYVLIVISEIMYFMTEDARADCARCVPESLALGDDALLIDWLGQPDTPVRGDAAADRTLPPADKREWISVKRF
ncbi:MAG: hypothetical protein AAGF45_11175, partial [Pseudomonadota bacterium]